MFSRSVRSHRKKNDHDIFERSGWTQFLMLIKKIIFLELVEKDKENATHVFLRPPSPSKIVNFRQKNEN